MGRGESSDTIQFILDKSGPDPIDDLLATSGADKTLIEIAWTAPNDSLTTVTEYGIRCAEELIDLKGDSSDGALDVIERERGARLRRLPDDDRVGVLRSRGGGSLCPRGPGEVDEQGDQEQWEPDRAQATPGRSHEPVPFASPF